MIYNNKLNKNSSILNRVFQLLKPSLIKKQFNISMLLILVLFFSCNNSYKKSIKNISKPQSKAFEIVNPTVGFFAKINECVLIKWNWLSSSQIDSMIIYIDKIKLANVTNGQKVQIPGNTKVGNRQLKFKAFFNNKTFLVYRTITLLSNIEPRKVKIKINKILKHDSRAYTQGLEVNNGYFYESTGQYKESTMRKTNIQTGEVIDLISLKDDVFGEGMTIFKGKIYQLTWQSNTGYVYDLKSFNLEYDFVYPTEGWGLTNDSANLLMSDGSENIYFIDPEYFTEVKRIQVYDNQGKITRLNELEYINNKLYANVYGSDYFVVIDPQTGKVLEKVDCLSLKKRVKLPKTADVLNGIAWDSTNKKMYITGKYWPFMFDVNLQNLNVFN